MIGKKLGQYEITEEVGRGGMATVYRGYQASMQRHVAIKVIRSNILSQRTLRERFTREARLIARLEHPHLLPVHDFESESDPPYIVMRFLEGGTLSQVIKAGGVPHGEMIYMMRQIASALDYAHRQGVVHRDLKPSNIMVDKEGNAFLADFGIAHVAEAEGEDLTATGAMIGTPAYMAPEQARGGDDVTHAADLYSLGVVLFELLTRKHPYPKERPVEVLMAHVQDPVPSIRERSPGFSEAADAVMKRALAKDPADRFESATALVDALAQALGEQAEAPQELMRMTTIIAADQLAAMMKGNEDEDSSGTGSRERQRQLTAVYVDVTEWAEVLYAEHEEQSAVKTRMDALWDRYRKIAETYGGKIHSRVDEVGVILWGLDATSEIDPEQAIRAALDMQAASLAAARKLWGKDWEPSDENPLPFQAGVTTGLVLLESGTANGTQTASGPTITLASRLKDSAPPGKILVSHDTYTHVRGVFTFNAHPAIRVRGRKGLLDVYVAVTAKPRAFRLQARGIEGVETEMVGREIEMRVLQEALTLTIEDKETQVVTVVGDAGVGKSRLLYELTNWVDIVDETLWFFEARATQPSQLQPYSLTRDLFSFRFQIADNDPLPVVKDKFVPGVLGFLGEGNERKARLIGQLVGFDFSDDPDVQRALQNPEGFQQEALGYLGELFAQAAETHPVFIQVEDLHWADDRSMDLLNNLTRENQKLPLFIIYMTRPSVFERRPSWGEGQLYHHRVQLEPLSRLSMRRLVRELLKLVEEVPSELRDLIIDRAEGNPFYAEELVKTLIDDGVVVKGETSWSVDMGKFSKLRIPQTLTGVLQARLDALEPPQRALLQRASVVGRVFWESAAAHLGEAEGVRTATTADLLESLRAREMVLKREESNFEGTQEFIFRHAILRDVTYESIVPAQRRKHHERVAEWLLKIGGDRHEEYTLLVAEHYQMADRPADAAACLRRAGERVTEHGSIDDALKLLEKAVGLAVPEASPEEWLRCVLAIADVLYDNGQLPETRSRLEEAVTVAEALTDPDLTVRFLIAHARVLEALGEVVVAEAKTRKALGLVDQVEDPVQHYKVTARLGTLEMTKGNHDEAHEHFQRARMLATEIGDALLLAGVCNAQGNLYLRMGDPDAAVGQYAEGEALAREHGLDRMLLYLLGNRLGALFDSEKWDELAAGAEELLAASREQNNRHFLAVARMALGTVAMERGDLETAEREARASLAIHMDGGSPGHALDGISLFGELCIRAGDPERGLALVGLYLADDGISGRDRLIMEERIRKHLPDLSEQELEDGLKRGEGLVLEDVAREILGSASQETTDPAAA